MSPTPNRAESTSMDKLCCKCSDEKNKMMMQCESCCKMYCTKCLGMKKPVFDALSSISNSHWFCDGCNDPVMSLIKNDRTIKEACAKYMQSFSQRLQTVEKSITENVTAEKVEELQHRVESLTQSVEQLKSKSTDNSGRDDDNKNVLLQDRLARKNNAIFFNIHEPEGNIKKDHIEHDKAKISSIAQEIGVSLTDTDVLAIKRLGKKGQVRNINGEDTAGPRLLLVTFTGQAKLMMMKNACKLQDSMEMKNIRIKHDMNKEDRQREYELRKEAKTKQNESTDDDFLYLVRGPMWDRKIIKIRKQRT